MKKLFLILAMVLIELSAFGQNTKDLLEQYISVKNALVSSNGNVASERIKTMNSSLKNEENFPQKAELLKATEKLQKAGKDIDKQRAAFNIFSTAMWDLVKVSEKVEEPVYYQYCPMKEGNWLSMEKEIKNPFYGSAMLTCGKVIESTK